MRFSSVGQSNGILEDPEEACRMGELDGQAQFCALVLALGCGSARSVGAIRPIHRTSVTGTCSNHGGEVGKAIKCLPAGQEETPEPESSAPLQPQCRHLARSILCVRRGALLGNFSSVMERQWT